jgi:hypothetical protein
MLALKRSLLYRKQILINVLKALAPIISTCSLHVILLSKVTPRYFRGDALSIHCKMSLRESKSMRKLNGPSLVFVDFYVPALAQSLNFTETSLQLSENIKLSGVCTESKSKPKLCYDRQSVGQSVLEQNTNLGLNISFITVRQLQVS